ncbi:MAG TPA: histidine kinase dimerization/phospho-acceptor domain-containing protein, partial [Anaerolineales bacterium]|nr:histidine kinase dimerization/phospho-acceptor domain-containing protein [Anaerolineales bacterium]
MIGWVREHLGVKLFLSYLAVILVGIIVLAVAAELAVPQSFERHMADMMGGQSMRMMGIGSRVGMGADLLASFRSAVNEALLISAVTAFLAAALASLFISRRVVAPVQEMTVASQRIAEGSFEERVRVPGNTIEKNPDELGQLAISFNRMAAQLEQVESLRQQLIGDVAHELRTPLAAIKGSMEGLIDAVIPASPETYQRIYLEADRLGRLVDDLQELSRVEASAYELNLQPTQVQNLVEAAVTRLRMQFEEKEVQLEAIVPASLPQVTVDEDRIEQVLLNLLGNALQYTPARGTVIISARQDQDEIRISISDNGIGIPA